MKLGMKLFVIFSMLIISTIFAKKQYNTSITLSLDKTEFVLYEKLFLNIEIKNFDDFGPKIYALCDLNEYLKVVRLEDNTIFDPTMTISKFYKQPGMEKDKIIKGRIDINDDYGKLVNPDVLYLCLPVGSYKVYCEYLDPTMREYEPIKSNEVIFYIREGVDKEKEVQKLFKECLLNIQEKNFSALDANTEILAKKYYDSKIFSEVWRICMVFYVIDGNDIDKEKAIQKLIDVYQNQQNLANLSITLKVLQMYYYKTGNKEVYQKSFNQITSMTMDAQLKEICNKTLMQ
ncbi:MAG TPA: hypothetical protein PLP19_22225 [bacterium]|nr:hypothetical protein [bacterium]HPN46218.1 hypothetical protein [bacterium]